MKNFVLIILLTTLLTGCADTALTGANVAYDRYSISQSISDHKIAAQARSNLYQVPSVYDHSNISVMTLHGNLLLAGQAPTSQVRERAGELVSTVKGVKKVYNFITVGKNESVGEQLNDSWITTKIKTQFLTDERIDPAAFKVMTDNGVVFLMGEISPQQASEAVKIARATNGVKEVVKIFEYVHLSPTPYRKDNTQTASTSAQTSQS